jgi:hypothetical protein
VTLRDAYLRIPPAIRKAILWVVGNLALWALATLIFAIWIDHVVQEEFRTGVRTDTGHDNVMIPIAGFAIALFATMLLGNIIWIIVAAILRRRLRSE